METYRAVDAAIGEAMRVAPGADFIVMSDHGLAKFERGFQLNAWLADAIRTSEWTGQIPATAAAPLH